MTTEVSFTTLVRKAQLLGATTSSDQHGGVPILVCGFAQKAKADEMQEYAVSKGWEIIDDTKEGKQFLLTITAPQEIDYASLLRRYIALVKQEVGQDFIPDEHEDFSAEEINALDELSSFDLEHKEV